MAKTTDNHLRSQVIYSVYIRNHTPEGTFRSIISDLDRIKALGIDIIWFMPIHPIGIKGKKGSLGCPYANRDYRSVNPEYGTMDDFRALVDAIHERGMKCIIDVVYNHTSPDATLVTEHPEFYYRKPNGAMGNRVGDWTDVVDLDYGNKDLWDYQIESLVMWAGIVDGFRCDVASFVPVDFWMKARKACEDVRPGCIWLGETVHSSFALHHRQLGMYCGNDYDMFQAFDMEYDYDIREVFDRYMKGECSLSHYMDALNFQECLYPSNYNKLRCLENHDQPRICSFVKDLTALENFTAFLFFLKGTTMVYAGQEYQNIHVPSLFDKDLIEWDASKDISPLVKKLVHIKKGLLSCEDFFRAASDDENDIAILERDDNITRKLGIFSLKAKAATIQTNFPDGSYTNRLNGKSVEIKDGKLFCDGTPIILANDGI